MARGRQQRVDESRCRRPAPMDWSYPAVDSIRSIADPKRLAPHYLCSPTSQDARDRALAEAGDQEKLTFKVMGRAYYRSALARLGVCRRL